MGTVNILKVLASDHKNGEANATIDFLVVVASLGKCSIVRDLIRAGHSVHARSRFFGRLLPAAAASGNTELVQSLLEEGADTNDGDKICIRQEHPPLVKLDYRSNQLYGSALQVASLKGHLALVDLLLEPRWQVTDYNRVRRGRQEALNAAATAGHGNVLSRLWYSAQGEPITRLHYRDSTLR